MNEHYSANGKDSVARERESQLLASIANGDEQAMATLFELHSGLVFSVALRVLREPGGAEDVMQEVFMQIWRKPASFAAARGSLGGYLAVIARNRAIDVLRGRRPTISVEDVPLPSLENLGDDAEHNILLERVRIAMKNLPVEQSETLEMAFFAGCTHSEIASSTGTPLGTVKTRVRSALHALKGALDQ